MAKEKDTPQGGAQITADPEPKFSVESLGAHCMDLFGVSSTTYAGATAGMEGEYTVREMKEHIEAWSKKEAH